MSIMSFWGPRKLEISQDELFTKEAEGVGQSEMSSEFVALLRDWGTLDRCFIHQSAEELSYQANHGILVRRYLRARTKCCLADQSETHLCGKYRIDLQYTAHVPLSGPNTSAIVCESLAVAVGRLLLLKSPVISVTTDRSLWYLPPCSPERVNSWFESDCRSVSLL